MDFEKIAYELEQLFNEKQKIYGKAYFQEPNERARYYGGLYRKLYRLHHYMTGKKKATDIEETYKDLAIYSIMEIMYLRLKHKPKKFSFKKK